MSSFLLPAATLWQRELVRFWRQKSRVMGVVASPLVFWLLMGYGSNDLGRFYAGALVLTVMFSAIFSTISIIEDRREGFLLSMLVSFTLTGLGFVIAWKMDSTSGFHAIMNLLLVPMWMVSGALFPMATAQGVIRAIMWANPLTYSISLLNALLGLPNATPGPVESAAVTLGFGLVLLVVSGLMASQKS